MNTKLTLKLEKKVVSRAKRYAAQKKTSVSKLVERYLSKITSGENPTEEISPLVKSLSGVITLPEGFDLKKDYGDYLIRKYD